jgi:hypothetical protein
MKNETKIKTKAESLNGQGIKKASPLSPLQKRWEESIDRMQIVIKKRNNTYKPEQSHFKLPQSPLLRRGRGEACSFLLSSAGGAGERLCKGPPGRSPCPGMGQFLFPNHPPNG